jgi:hypothetical protein
MAWQHLLLSSLPHPHCLSIPISSPAPCHPIIPQVLVATGNWTAKLPKLIEAILWVDGPSEGRSLGSSVAEAQVVGWPIHPFTPSRAGLSFHEDPLYAQPATSRMYGWARMCASLDAMRTTPCAQARGVHAAFLRHYPNARPRLLKMDLSGNLDIPFVEVK